ncbi:MAG: phospho-sugar mutase [Lachnospiraceae bacterium]|nr:phospho-sugar mutase [Lachnospiraceae bacterium]
MTYKERFNDWMEKMPKEDGLRPQLEALSEDENLMAEAFSKDMVFGTSGLRGITGVGSNRMNYYTVARATRGIAAYIKEAGSEAKERGVIIAHDPRYFSEEFSQLTACIMARAGIRVYTFEGMRPTPELAFLIRELKAVSGINITASHNPPEYNGYKVYWEDGCQVSADVAKGMMESIEKLDYFLDSNVDFSDYRKLIDSGKIVILGDKEDTLYLDKVKSISIHSGNELDLSIPIVYTPLNGAGAIPFAKVMADRGFMNFHIVPKQRDPDPDFTTVGYPNPEDPKAFALGEKLAESIGAELIMATDPDADRFAIEVRSKEGDYVPLNGNQTGYLLVNYILEGHRSAGTLPKKGAMVKSIVTSSLSEEIAASYGVKMFESLIGFKNICGRIPFLEKNGYTYLFGYEQSVGYAACPDIRDKDGISAGMLVAEAAAYYRKQGKSLFEILSELGERYGYYAESEPNFVLQGISGAARIERMMESVRSSLPKDRLFPEQLRQSDSKGESSKAPSLSSIAGIEVARVIDYTEGYEDIPPSNVVRFFLENGSWFGIRPSGTEPKIKFYFYSKADSFEKAAEVNNRIKEAVLSIIQEVD